MFLHWWCRWQVDPLHRDQSLALVMTLLNMWFDQDATHMSAHHLWPFLIPESVKNIQYIGNRSWIGRSSRPTPWDGANFFRRLSKIQCAKRNVYLSFVHYLIMEENEFSKRSRVFLKKRHNGNKFKIRHSPAVCNRNLYWYIGGCVKQNYFSIQNFCFTNAHWNWVRVALYRRWTVVKC
jgi:hypothetical protein